MANKSKVQGPKAKVQACLRCGCTEDRACAGGCGWVAKSNVCDACLSSGEAEILSELCDAFGAAQTEIEMKRAQDRLAIFGRYLDENSAHIPIPYVVVKKAPLPTPKGGAK